MAEKPCDLFIFVGESSADLHGEALLKALFLQNPHLQIWGVCGPKMRAQEALFTFAGRISASREGVDVAMCDDGIASAIS